MELLVNEDVKHQKLLSWINNTQERNHMAKQQAEVALQYVTSSKEPEKNKSFE